MIHLTHSCHYTSDIVSQILDSEILHMPCVVQLNHPQCLTTPGYNPFSNPIFTQKPLTASLHFPPSSM